MSSLLWVADPAPLLLPTAACDQPQRNRQAFELVVRLEEELRRVVAGVALTSSTTTSAAASGLRALSPRDECAGIAVDVLHDPCCSQLCMSLALLERADLVAHDALQVVREAAAREQVRQPRRRLAFAVASGSSYSVGFCSDCAPMNAAKSRVLPVDQRHQAVLGELRLAPVADGDLGRALHVDAAVVGREGVRGRPSTAPPDSTPRMREHQPYSLNERLMLTAIA